MIIRPDGSRHPTVTATGIYGFFGEYRWLSNFHPCLITMDDLVYRSTEAAYQAMKSLDLGYRMELAGMDDPMDAKRAGRRIRIRDNWEHLRLPYMQIVQIKKYLIHDLRTRLLMTNLLYLEETNNWNDRFWGVVDGDGLNMLGHCIMITRDHYLGLEPEEVIL